MKYFKTLCFQDKNYSNNVFPTFSQNIVSFKHSENWYLLPQITNFHGIHNKPHNDTKIVVQSNVW